MDIDDFEIGTQYIILYESMFKDKEDFNDLKKFLKIDPSETTIYVPIDYYRIEKYNTMKRERPDSVSCR